jgi:hypothetical protein
MPVTCNFCDVRLFGDELAEGVCENCQAAPVAPRPDAPAAGPAWVARQESRARRAVAEWRWVALGLRLLSWGLIVNLVVAAGSVALAVFASSVTRDVASPFVGAGSLVTAVLFLSGIGLCCLTPRRGLLRPLSWITGGCTVLYALSLVALAGSAWLPAGETDRGALLLLIVGLALVVFVCLCLLLGAIARAAGDRHLAGKFLLFILLGPLVPFAAAVVFGVVTAVLTRSGELAAQRTWPVFGCTREVDTVRW